MGLLSHALALGLGYTLGRPDGRERLAALGRQAAELTRRPEATRLRRRVQNLATEQWRGAADTAAHRLEDGDGTSGTGGSPDSAAGRRPRPSPATRPTAAGTGTGAEPDTAVATAAAGTAAAADGLRASPASDTPTPPVPPTGAPLTTLGEESRVTRTEETT